jgi:predicted phage terminase large subunit-like protein
VDDPHNIQKSSSPVERQKAIDWWDKVMTSRLNDQLTGKRLVIGQRAHENDLIGHLLEQGGWEYLKLPAEFEPTKKTFTTIGWKDPRTEENEPLWPEKFPREVLDGLKNILLGEYYTQYQQTPTPEGGTIIKESMLYKYVIDGDWFVLYGKNGERRIPKKSCSTVVTTDLALSKTQQADYTVFLVWALTPWYDFLLLDVIRDRMEAPESEEKLFALLLSTDVLWCVIIEDVAFQKSVIQRTQQKGFPVLAYTPIADKVARLKNFSVYFANGQVFIPIFASWLATYVQELTTFPASRRADQVDATSILQALFKLGTPRIRDLDSDILDDIREEEAKDKLQKMMDAATAELRRQRIAEHLAAVRKQDTSLERFLTEDNDD